MSSTVTIASIAFVLASRLAAAQTPTQVITDALEGNTGQSSGVGALRFGQPDVVLAVLRQQTTTLPAGSAAGGFSWVFDPSLGIVVRRSQSFGGLFSDRPFTTGFHRLSIAVATQHTAWRSLAGETLSDGLYASDAFLDDFYTDNLEPVIERYGSILDLRTDRTIINATYGVTSRFDLGVVIAFGRTAVTGAVDATYTHVGSGTVYRRSSGQSTSFASGPGDLTVRGKYLLVSRPTFALASAGDLRLPTGSEDDLLGTGRVQGKVSVLASSTLGPFMPHIEGGYVFGGPGLRFDERFGSPELTSAAPSDEITYSIGADAVAGRRVTLGFDLLGRSLRNSAAIVRDEIVRPNRHLVFFDATPGSVSVLLGAAGGKVAIGSAWLVTGSVLFPLNDSGIKPGITPVFGFERAF